MQLETSSAELNLQINFSRTDIYMLQSTLEQSWFSLCGST